MSLYAPGEMTESQFATALDFTRLLRVMQEKLSAGAAALDKCGVQVDDKAFDKLFWQMEDAGSEVQRRIAAHLDATMARLQEQIERRAA